MKDKKVPLYVIKRFGVDSFIFEMSQLYELVLFSSSKN
jgi:TFIIF-interacting CTD phosphatase-like protein